MEGGFIFCIFPSFFFFSRSFGKNPDLNASQTRISFIIAASREPSPGHLALGPKVGLASVSFVLEGLPTTGEIRSSFLPQRQSYQCPVRRLHHHH